MPGITLYSEEKSNSGMALVMVIVFTGALLVMGGALISYAVNEKLIAGYHTQDIQKYYLAESGIEAGLAALRNSYYYSEEISGTLDGGFYSVSFEDLPGERRIIKSTGSIEGFSLVIHVVVKLDPDTGLVICEWKRP